jgi:uncharacterized protein (DUF1697 family)
VSRLAVLLRAINVGGAGKLAMADLKAALADLGCAQPRTLGAAGSAVVEAGDDPAALEARIEADLKARFGLASEVFVRDHAALAATLAANPFHDMARDDPSHLLVLFLKSDPAPADVEALRGKIQGPEQVAAGPACLYAAYPAGIGTSKLTGAIIERALKLKGTGRNWNTVTKLNELTTGA